MKPGKILGYVMKFWEILAVRYMLKAKWSKGKNEKPSKQHYVDGR